MPSDSAVLFAHRDDTVLMLWGVSGNHAAKEANLRGVTLRAKRALLRPK